MRSPRSSVIRFLVASFTTVAACGTIQHAQFNKPRVDTAGVESRSDENTVAIRLTEACIDIEESIGSAKFDNLTYGPVVAPIFPLGILSPLPDAPYFGVTMRVEPRSPDLSLDPATSSVTFDSATVGASTVRVLSRSPVILMKTGAPAPPDHVAIDSIVRPIAVTGTSLIELRFPKPNQLSAPRRLALPALSHGGRAIALPPIVFEAVSKTRILMSGQVITGEWVSDLVDGCARFTAPRRADGVSP